MDAREGSPQLTQDQTEMLVLSVLAERPSYGYAIGKQIAARSEEAFRVGASQLYPLLTRLEKQGLVTTDWEEIKSPGAEPGARGRRRKWYRLSPKGQRRLASRIAAHQRFTAIMDSFIGGVSGDPA